MANPKAGDNSPKTFDEFVEAMADTELVVTFGSVTAVIDTGLSYEVLPGRERGLRPWHWFDGFRPPLEIAGLKKGLYLLNGTYEAEAALLQQLSDDPSAFEKQATRAGYLEVAEYINDLIEKLKMKEDAMAMLIQACIRDALDSHMQHPRMEDVGHPEPGLPAGPESTDTATTDDDDEADASDASGEGKVKKKDTGEFSGPM